MKNLRDRAAEPSLVELRPRGRKGRRRPAEEGPDRLLRTHSGALVFLGLTLGVFVGRRFLILPVAVVAGVAVEIAQARLLRRFGAR